MNVRFGRSAATFVMALLILCRVGAPAAAVQERMTDESLLKAAYIFNFAKFTRWPQDAWGQEAADLGLCTLGDSPLVDALQQLAGKRIKGHRVAVRPVAPAQVPRSCRLLFIADAQRIRANIALEAVRTRPVLTITESADREPSGVMITLYREGDRVRFIIDVEVARQARLEFSSRLLSLGDVVDRSDGP